MAQHRVNRTRTRCASPESRWQRRRYAVVRVPPDDPKNITITEDAYERLRALKREDESFSDLVVRLTESEDPMRFAGSCPGLSEHVPDSSSLDDDLQKRQDELFG